MSTSPDHPAATLLRFVRAHPRLFVITGAGCSTGSGIPDYRDPAGEWKRRQPVSFQEFMGQHATRQRYWARSLVGWPAFARARPNPAHHALRRLQRLGHVGQLVTQNVDRLHQRAGQDGVIDLHGRIDRIRCMQCGRIGSRAGFQRTLAEANPTFAGLGAEMAPDGDADLEALDFSGFEVPGCRGCGGLVKPDVVFFGESVPPERVQAAGAALAQADALLAVGTSLMVYSGFRFCRQAQDLGIPIASLNIGRTRADAMLALKLEADCAATLAQVAAALDADAGLGLAC